jgi:SAM-dependent methyltransferase
MAIPSTCPLCSSEAQHQNVVTKHVYGDEENKHAFYQCETCDVIYLYPQLSIEKEQQFYAKEFEGFMSSRSGFNAGWHGPEEHIKANTKQYERRWAYLKNHLSKPGQVLELGCSSGFMLLPLLEMGFDCYGVEPSGVFSDFVRNKGVHIYENITEIDIQFDIIMNFFVMEHIRQPIKFIQDSIKLLKDDGLLIIEIPNANDPLATIYDINSFERFYWSIAHHWYFTEKSVQYLLGRIPGIEFNIFRDQRYDLSNHLVWARDNKPGGMNQFSHIFGDKLDSLYKETLIKSGFCDTLILKIKRIH